MYGPVWLLTMVFAPKVVDFAMCRLLGFVADRARPMHDAVGPDTLATFRALARVHGDGWGAARTDGTGQPAVRRSTRSAAVDDGFPEMTDEPAKAAFVHLRWATTGLAVNLSNTHPFAADGWAFAHNGFVRGSDRIAELLPARHRALLSGTTDSERYFRLVLHCAEQVGDMLGAVREASRLIRDVSGAVSINAMLLSSTQLLAVQGLSGAQPPLDDLLALVPNADHLPLDHLDAYFHLAYRADERRVVISSSGLPRHGWTPIPHDSVMDVAVGTGAWTLTGLLGETAPSWVSTASVDRSA